VGIIACNGGDPPAADTECSATGTESTGDPATGVESSGAEDPTTVATSESATGEETLDPSSESTTEPVATESSESGTRCGDGTCDADEDETSCCDDCGCAEGSSCVESVCTPDPFCGDGTCNGAETQDDCCDDCGCAEGSACQEGACVVLPYCGDGSCNGTETMDDCCDDCGCGEGYTCEDNACACTNAWVHFDNLLEDTDQYCFATASFYTQEAVAYLNDGVSGWQYMDDAGFVDVYGDVGQEIDVTVQCCVLDACGGNQICPTPLGNYPCFCTDPQGQSADIVTCGENVAGICG
jgi:hypothetical protein